MVTPELAADVSTLLTMRCGDQRTVVPGVMRDDWPLEGSWGGKPVETRAIHDEIHRRVRNCSVGRDRPDAN
jgi:arsenate reductase